jgi:hypothetical protein
LVTLGIAADRMTIVSFGEERPLDPGHNEAAGAKNRRDDFKVIEVCAGENVILPGFLLTFLASKLFLKEFKFKTILYDDCLNG